MPGMKRYLTTVKQRKMYNLLCHFVIKATLLKN